MMLQTDNKASPTIPVSLSGKTGGKQADIVKRLEELNKWQEEQKKLLEVRQTMQRQMLSMEQKTMYQMMGLQDEHEVRDVEEESKEDITSEKEGKHANAGYAEDYENYEQDDELTDGRKSAEPISYKTLTSGYATEDPAALEQPQNSKPKRQFLKRGQGLKQRFNIDPEELRISNLPRYKYANAHPKLRLNPKKPANSQSSKTIARQRPAAAVQPQTTSAAAVTLDLQEQRFQQLLISSKNVCNSTPDNKSTSSFTRNLSEASSTTSTSLPKVRFVDQRLVVTKNAREYGCAEDTTAQTPNIAWAKILDNQQIQPLAIKRQTKPDDLQPTEQDIFELLEQKAKDGSFDMDSTCIQEFMKRRINEQFNDTDVIPVNDKLKTKRLQPLVIGDAMADEASSSLEEVEEASTMGEEATEIDGDDDTTHKTVDSINSSYPATRTTENRVRFSDAHDTHEYQDENTTLTDATALSNVADHTNDEFFQQFKQALFAALQGKADQHNSETINSASETTITPKDSFIAMEDSPKQIPNLELQEKTDLIKIRLLELEKEIVTFKENNLQLMKAKQEHELQIALHAQEQLEANERLKDEKIQMEIYLHDERMKLEEEKRKYEQQLKMKTQAAASNKGKEMEKLKEQVAQLEVQLKNKEANHAAAQARWRTQIRSMERDEKKLHQQIESLSKENKRMENEMMKYSRENNNKLLQEINRNIAKLAPKQHAFPDDDSPPVLASSRSLSKTIGAQTAANRNSKSPTKVNIAEPKRTKKKLPTTNARLQKQALPETPSSEDENETNFKLDNNNSRNYNKIKPDSINYDDEDDDDDILKELQNDDAPTGRKKEKPTSSKEKVTSTQKAPPSSPTNMKREIVNADGSKDIWYPNGNLKKISADGLLIRMLYFNQDIKETSVTEGTVKYYYAQTNTWHTTYLDGLEILEFPNGQIEHRHKTGVVEVHYPNNSIKIMDPRDDKKSEEWRFVDGTHLVQMRNGDKILSLPNGQKEIHTKLQKRREYPDGTVKIVYPDGSTETRYSNGRVRLKDKDGILVMDTEEAAT